MDSFSVHFTSLHFTLKLKIFIKSVLKTIFQQCFFVGLCVQSCLVNSDTKIWIRKPGSKSQNKNTQKSFMEKRESPKLLKNLQVYPTKIKQRKIVHYLWVSITLINSVSKIWRGLSMAEYFLQKKMTYLNKSLI